MRTSISFAALVVLILCLSAGMYAQGTCNLQTLAGTYVMVEKGSSLILNPSAQPVPAHFAGPMAQFVNITEITFNADGVGDGFFWIWDGAIRATLDPIPVRVFVTEINPDCTGKFSYSVNVLGAPTATLIEERFVAFDNGREIRTVPTSIQNGIPSLAWIGSAHRMSKGTAGINSCGPQTRHGKYLMECENIVRPNPTTAVADTFLLLSDVSLLGDFTGMLYEKYGQKTVELPVTGTMSVNPDCSFAGTLVVPTKPGTIHTRGVFFDEGKQYYAMGIMNDALTPEQQGLLFSFCKATRISQ